MLSKDAKFKIYCYDPWSFALREEHTLRVFEKRMLREYFDLRWMQWGEGGENGVIRSCMINILYQTLLGWWNEEGRDLCDLWHAWGTVRSAYKILVWKPAGKRPFVRPRCRWEDTINIYLRKRGWECVGQIGRAEDRDWRQAVVNTVINLVAP
jgi:hypothetical protein